MLALRRARMEASPPILRGAFRPFFFGGALWAVVALTIWLVTGGAVTVAIEDLFAVVIDPLELGRESAGRAVGFLFC